MGYMKGVIDAFMALVEEGVDILNPDTVREKVRENTDYAVLGKLLEEGDRVYLDFLEGFLGFMCRK